MPKDLLYKRYNMQFKDRYEASIERINKISSECTGVLNKPYTGLFKSLTSFVLRLCDLEKELNDKYFSEHTLDELMEVNHYIYCDIMEEGYEKSYSNPQYSVSNFGDGTGQLIAYFHSKFREYVDFTYKHKLYKMCEYNEWLIQVYEYIKNNNVEYSSLQDIIVRIESENIKRDREVFLMEDNNPDYSFLSDISLNSDLNDLRYLFKYGRYISENELIIAKLLQEYDEEKVEHMAKTVVNAFLNGFETHSKNRKQRNIVRIVHVIGQETISRQIIRQLKMNNLSPVIASTYSTEVSREFENDHKLDWSIYATSDYFKLFDECSQKAAENCRDILYNVAGNVITLQFGQKLKRLGKKPETPKPADNQIIMMKEHSVRMRNVIEKYVPRYETSYTGVAFPSPQIGDRFKEIYKSIWEVNTMDSTEHVKIQQIIADTMDKGAYVHVKGRGDNQTDIKVRIHELLDPEKETAFENCGADVNIPVGEVFTSPVLKGTEGMVHVSEVLIRDTKYYDLILRFKDGFIEEYTCSNFADKIQNKKLIEENIFCYNKTLPMGEFAIGTNTLAYTVTREYGIVDELHTLIVEKMGPHFAGGDTCFAWQEDQESFNFPNNKRIVAKENEKTAKRKVDVSEAYTNTHSDITLPYESIEFITVCTKNGEMIDIIRDGRFVLKGTEKLNEPLKK